MHNNQPINITTLFFQKKPAAANKDVSKVEKKYLYPHGVCPPLKNVRKRRFRKVLRKNFAEAPEIEKEVKHLLRVDNEAVDVKWELVCSCTSFFSVSDIFIWCLRVEIARFAECCLFWPAFARIQEQAEILFWSFSDICSSFKLFFIFFVWKEEKDAKKWKHLTSKLLLVHYSNGLLFRCLLLWYQASE